MPRRHPKTDPEIQAHKEWLGYLQPRGLVVAPAAMGEAGWVLEQSGRELLERQELFREALQPLGPGAEDDDKFAHHHLAAHRLSREQQQHIRLPELPIDPFGPGVPTAIVWSMNTSWQRRRCS